jgi:hypothetical protein
VCNKSKGFKNWLKMLKNLRKVVGLFKYALFPYTDDKEQRTLITITNCSLYVYRCCISLIVLMLNTSLTPSLLIVA